MENFIDEAFELNSRDPSISRKETTIFDMDTILYENDQQISAIVNKRQKRQISIAKNRRNI